ATVDRPRRGRASGGTSDRELLLTTDRKSGRGRRDLEATGRARGRVHLEVTLWTELGAVRDESDVTVEGGDGARGGASGNGEVVDKEPVGSRIGRCGAGRVTRRRER